MKILVLVAILGLVPLSKIGRREHAALYLSRSDKFVCTLMGNLLATGNVVENERPYSLLPITPPWLVVIMKLC